MAEYIIVPDQRINGAYVWTFPDLAQAQAEASEVSSQYHTNVVVAKIIGRYSIDPQWIEADGGM